jgi:hypothetical protein
MRNSNNISDVNNKEKIPFKGRRIDLRIIIRRILKKWLVWV